MEEVDDEPLIVGDADEEPLVMKDVEKYLLGAEDPKDKNLIKSSINEKTSSLDEVDKNFKHSPNTDDWSLVMEMSMENFVKNISYLQGTLIVSRYCRNLFIRNFWWSHLTTMILVTQLTQNTV